MLVESLRVQGISINGAVEAERKMEWWEWTGRNQGPVTSWKAKSKRVTRKRCGYEMIQWVQGSEHSIDSTGFVKSTIINSLNNCLSNVGDWSRGVRCGGLRSKWKEKTYKHSVDQHFKYLSHRNFDPWLEEILKMEMGGNFVYVTGLEWRYVDVHQNIDIPYPLKVGQSMLCSPLWAPGLSTMPENCGINWTKKGHFPPVTLRKKGWRVRVDKVDGEGREIERGYAWQPSSSWWVAEGTICAENKGNRSRFEG